MSFLVVRRAPLSDVPAQQAGFAGDVVLIDRGTHHLEDANLLDEDVVLVVVAEVTVGHVDPSFAVEKVGCGKDD